MTIAQSVVLDGTNYVMHAAQNWSGLLSQFQGSGGIWRRAAIDDAGGWQTDTLLEDLDLSFRAQIRGWKMKILPQVPCAGELPVTITAAKSQQLRWAKGGMQNALKLTPMILRSDLSAVAKSEAVLFLWTGLLHPCILFLALSWPLQVWFRDSILLLSHPLLGTPVFLLSFMGPLAFFLYAQISIYSGVWRSPFNVLLLFVYGLGIAINNTRAVIEAILGIKSGFQRTPKFGIERKSDTAADKDYRMKIGGQLIVETLVFVYCLTGVVVMALQSRVLVDPILIVSTCGLFVIIGQSISEAFSRRSAEARGVSRTVAIGARVIRHCRKWAFPPFLPFFRPATALHERNDRPRLNRARHQMSCLRHAVEHKTRGNRRIPVWHVSCFIVGEPLDDGFRQAESRSASMAYKIIASQCTGCSACEFECPNAAISMKGETFIIDPAKCTECEGHYDHPQCDTVCPVPNTCVPA